MLDWISVNCPYCGESFETGVDRSAGAQEYTEDCPVCCNPIVFTVTLGWDGELLAVSTRQENE